MDQQSGIKQIKDACNSIGRELMRIHPAVPSLADQPTQDEVFQALFRLTKDVEIIKKKMIKLEAQAPEQPDL